MLKSPLLLFDLVHSVLLHPLDFRSVISAEVVQLSVFEFGLPNQLVVLPLLLLDFIIFGVILFDCLFQLVELLVHKRLHLLVDRSVLGY